MRDQGSEVSAEQNSAPWFTIQSVTKYMRPKVNMFFTQLGHRQHAIVNSPPVNEQLSLALHSLDGRERFGRVLPVRVNDIRYDSVSRDRVLCETAEPGGDIAI